MPQRWLLLALLLVACCDAHRPSRKIGNADAVYGSGTTHSISAQFSKKDLQVLYDRLNSPEFQERLGAYTCGDPPPGFDFTVSIFEQGEFQERTVLVQQDHDPKPSGRERCLMFGLDYEVDRELLAIDRGEPINYHYRDPHTGNELPPRTRKLGRRPVCDCSNRDSGREWVTWLDPAATQ